MARNGIFSILENMPFQVLQNSFSMRNVSICFEDVHYVDESLEKIKK